MNRRNDPCSCGSGKKYKRCHGLTEGRLRQAEREGSSHGNRTLHERNMMVLDAVRDTFGLRRVKKWSDVPNKIDPSQVREIYLEVARAWPRDTEGISRARPAPFWFSVEAPLPFSDVSQLELLPLARLSDAAPSGLVERAAGWPLLLFAVRPFAPVR